MSLLYLLFHRVRHVSNRQTGSEYPLMFFMHSQQEGEGKGEVSEALDASES